MIEGFGILEILYRGVRQLLGFSNRKHGRAFDQGADVVASIVVVGLLIVVAVVFVIWFFLG
ncbi:MAG: hypothetical protein AAGD11_16870 [Planctomycetota bacterium]